MCEWNGKVAAVLASDPYGPNLEWKDLRVLYSFELPAKAGTGAGSVDGWRSYRLMRVEAGSIVGLAYLPSGRLCLFYTEEGAAKVRHNDGFGMEDAGWSAPAAVTPDTAAVISQCRGNRHTDLFRIG